VIKRVRQVGCVKKKNVIEIVLLIGERIVEQRERQEREIKKAGNYFKDINDALFILIGGL